MPSQRQSQGTLQRQGVPIRAELEGPRVQKPKATYTSTTEAPRPRRPRSNRTRPRSSKRNINVASYSPTRAGDKTSAGIGLLEAEYFGIIFILVAGLIFGSDTYGNKIMAFMKRGFLASVLFFFLALIAGMGPNAAKISKGLGALVFVAILISTPGQDIIVTLDNFFKQAWVGTSESATSSSDSGTGATTGVIGKIENAVTSGANRTTELQIPGIGPALVIGQPIVNALKKLFHL